MRGYQQADTKPIKYFFALICSISTITKFYTNLYDNKEGYKRFNKNKNNCVCYCKNSYYDANLTAVNLVLLDKTSLSISLNYENVNICKKSALHFPLRLSHVLHFFKGFSRNKFSESNLNLPLILF